MCRLHLAVSVMLVAGLAVISPSAQTPAPTQTPPQVFRGATTLVPVDVRVVDRNGKPVTDLTEADFTVLEGGVRQTLRHFSTQHFTPELPGSRSATSANASTAARAAVTAVPGIEPQNRRVFLIVLGRGRLQPPAKGVDGMLHFVRDRLLPQDLVAVLAWNRATEFTTDREKIVGVLERFKRAHEGIEEKLKLALSGLAAVYGSTGIPPALQSSIDAVFGGPNARAVRSVQPGLSRNAARTAEDTRDTTDLLLNYPDSDAAQSVGMSFDDFVGANAQTMQDLGNLYRGVEYLRYLPGEKHLIFASAAGLMLPRAEDDTDLASVAADARVVIDYIHTSGVALGTSLAGFSAENRGGGPSAGAGGGGGRGAPLVARGGGPADMWILSTARTVAELTGGRMWDRLPSAAQDMDAIDQATRFEYVLGYYPTDARLDGKYRRITVRVNRPGLTVLYRHGYFADGAVAPLDRERTLTYSRVAAAATYAEPIADLGLRALASVVGAAGALSVRVDITLDPSRFDFAKDKGHNTDALEVAIFCVDSRDRMMGQTWKTVHLTYTDDRLAVITKEPLPISLPVDVTGPPKNVKVVVYDHGSDLVGSVIVKMP